MKTLLKSFLLLMFTSSVIVSKSQNINDNTPVTWLGVDFTNAAYIGPPDKFNVSEFRIAFAEKVNDYIETQPEKYDISKYLNRETVYYKTEQVNAANKKLDISKHQATENIDENFTEAQIQKIIDNYKFDGLTTETGIMLIVKSLNKAANTEVAYLTYINIADSKVIHAERLTGKAKGFGMAAYWANPVVDMLKAMNKKLKKM